MQEDAPKFSPESKQFDSQATPARSEFAITQKLEGISERRSSDFGSKLSSGFGGKSNASGPILSSDKLKEIRHYVAHEIHRS